MRDDNKLTDLDFEREHEDSERAMHMLGDALLALYVVLILAVVVFALAPGPLGLDILRAQANPPVGINIK